MGGIAKKRKKYASHQQWKRIKKSTTVAADKDTYGQEVHATREDLAKALWGYNYHELIAGLVASNESLAEIVADAMPVRQKQYVRRLKGNALQTYLMQNQLKLSSFVAIILKVRNVQYRSFLLYARSIAALRQMLPTRWWNCERKTRLLLAKKTTWDMVKLMSENCPSPAFPTTQDIIELCYDQCNIWQGYVLLFYSFVTFTPWPWVRP